VLVLTIDEDGMAKTQPRKMEVAKLIHDIAVDEFGFKPEDLVFDVLTFRIVDPPVPPPAVLMELQWAVMSAMALVVGLVISCVATVMRDSGQTISMIGRMMYIGAGVSLIIGAVPLAWVIMGAKGSFRIIATSPTAPTAESIQDMIQSVEPTMTIGFAILVVAAVLLLVGGLAGFQASSSQTAGKRAPLAVVFAIGSVLVGVALLLLIGSVWLNGNALGMMITEVSVTPKPAELAAHLAGILNKSLFVFVGLGTLGLLQLLASIFAPSMGPDAGSEI
jgi:hypothetical protein